MLSSVQIRADQSDQPTLMNVINITWRALLMCWSGSDCSAGKGCSNVGYTSLKPKQENAINEFDKGHDVFVCLTTSYYGASFCQCCLIY